MRVATLESGQGVSSMTEKNEQKETAPEGSAQEQFPININRLRKEHGLEPIDGGDKDFIPIE